MNKQCTNCGTTFVITRDDLVFYEKISPVINSQRYSIPAPTFCPQCRQQRRLSWRNERSLFRRTCSATGKAIVSIHHSAAPFPVYDQDYYWSDQWDPYQYGQDLDPSKSFLEQFAELHKKVPQISVLSMGNENSEYVNLSSWDKNCYLLFESDNNQDCLYCDHTYFSKDSVNNSYVEHSQLLYECLDCKGSYSSAFLQNCENVTDSYFLKNCTSCKDCFGCVNLRNKQYCFFNEQLDKSEYSRRLHELRLNTTSGLENAKKKTFALFDSTFCKQYEGTSNENVTGNYIWNCKDMEHCFDVKNCRNCKYVCHCENTNDAYDIDVYGGERGMELVYEGNSIGNGCQRVAFATNIFRDVSDSYYCDFCHESSHLFGCISLRKARYCILNKQYPKDEYEMLVPEIIEQMKRDGEWGEFFPISMSPYGYNKTVAQEYYPLERHEVLELEWNWYDEVGDPPAVHKVIDAMQLPDAIEDIPDDVLNWAVRCAESGKLYRIQKMELDFHRKMQLPLPRLHPDMRYGRRMKLRQPRTLWKRNCAKCNKLILTAYSSNNPQVIYCEECYLQAIY